ARRSSQHLCPRRAIILGRPRHQRRVRPKALLGDQKAADGCQPLEHGRVAVREMPQDCDGRRSPGALEVEQGAVSVEQDRADGHAHGNGSRESRLMSCAVDPLVARSARISPIAGANLKPWPEQGDATITCGALGRLSMMKSWSGVTV